MSIPEMLKGSHKAICNLCFTECCDPKFPSNPSQAAIYAIGQGWFNHGLTVSICPVCLAYYSKVFEVNSASRNSSVPAVANLVQMQAVGIPQKPSQKLVVSRRNIWRRFYLSFCLAPGLIIAHAVKLVAVARSGMGWFRWAYTAVWLVIFIMELVASMRSRK